MPAKIDGRTKTAALKFIAAFDAKNGRGGVSAASRKYKITRVTISRWLAANPLVKETGAKPAKAKKIRKAAKSPKTKKVVRRRGRPAKSSGMKAFARGLIAVAKLQSKMAAQMKKLAAVVG